MVASAWEDRRVRGHTQVITSPHFERAPVALMVADAW